MAVECIEHQGDPKLSDFFQVFVQNLSEGEPETEMYFRQGEDGDWDFVEEQSRACNFAVYEEALHCIRKLHPIIERALAYSKTQGGYPPECVKLGVRGFIDTGRVKQ